MLAERLPYDDYERIMAMAIVICYDSLVCHYWPTGQNGLVTDCKV